MGTYYYGVCHTCRKRVGLGKRMWRLDPRRGPLVEAEIEQLTRALAGDAGAEEDEGMAHGELGYALAKLCAFVFMHGRHVIEIRPDDDDVLLGMEEQLGGVMWNDPLGHRRERHAAKIEQQVAEARNILTAMTEAKDRIASEHADLRSLEQARAFVEKISGADDKALSRVAAVGHMFGVDVERWIVEVKIWAARACVEHPTRSIEDHVRAVYVGLVGHRTLPET